MNSLSINNKPAHLLNFNIQRYVETELCKSGNWEVRTISLVGILFLMDQEINRAYSPAIHSGMEDELRRLW